jgi:hypothetical protein
MAGNAPLWANKFLAREPDDKADGENDQQAEKFQARRE